MNTKPENKTNLDVIIGKDELNNDLIISVPKLSHLLIAGIPGSGKSNLLHRIITTLSGSVSPSDLKFILIDSKKTELNVYNRLPHLLTQVITDAKKAVLAMKWAGKEMDRRLDVLQSEGIRDIEAYSSKDHKEDTMPYIFIVMDGLSDMLTTYPIEVEAVIARLTQMSHKVGIHLILSTSRVGNKIITEPIRSGMSSRISFKLPTSNDSENIIGIEGAEKLEVPAEILFQSVSMKYPICAKLKVITENEIEQNLSTIKKIYKEEVQSLIHPKYAEDYSENDDLYEDAKEAVIEAGKASTSYIQRKLGIGYSRAAQLMDILETNGIIGPANGSTPREVLQKE